jgi:hypothetical protein
MTMYNESLWLSYYYLGDNALSIVCSNSIIISRVCIHSSVVIIIRLGSYYNASFHNMHAHCLLSY